MCMWRDMRPVHGRGLLWIIQISSRMITTHEMTTDDWLNACPNAYTPMPPWAPQIRPWHPKLGSTDTVSFSDQQNSADVFLLPERKPL